MNARFDNEGMSGSVFLNLKNQSHSIEAEIDVPKGGANGVVVGRVNADSNEQRA